MQPLASRAHVVEWQCGFRQAVLGAKEAHCGHDRSSLTALIWTPIWQPRRARHPPRPCKLPKSGAEDTSPSRSGCPCVTGQSGKINAAQRRPRRSETHPRWRDHPTRRKRRGSRGQSSHRCSCGPAPSPTNSTSRDSLRRRPAPGRGQQVRGHYAGRAPSNRPFAGNSSTVPARLRLLARPPDSSTETPAYEPKYGTSAALR